MLLFAIQYGGFSLANIIQWGAHFKRQDFVRTREEVCEAIRQAIETGSNRSPVTATGIRRVYIVVSQLLLG